jgi:hypothetical protein
MPKTPYNLLTVQFQKRYKNKLRFGKMDKLQKGYLNNGLDTETYQGYVKLLCADIGTKDTPSYLVKDIDGINDIIEFLTNRNFKDCYNWFYNIQFDFESMIKYLDYGELVTLYHDHELLLDNGYTIRYLPRNG